MHTTPVSLLERVRRPGDREAWDRLVELYTPLLYTWGRRLGLQDPDVADLAQEVFVLLLEKLPDFTYDRNKTFQGWLRTVTLNKWRERRRRLGGTVTATEADLANLAGPDPLEALGEAEYRRHILRRALRLMQAEFQPTTWKACWELVVSGRPAAEVAAELGISVGAAYAAKFRVLSRLRQELSGLME